MHKFEKLQPILCQLLDTQDGMVNATKLAAYFHRDKKSITKFLKKKSTLKFISNLERRDIRTSFFVDTDADNFIWMHRTIALKFLIWLLGVRFEVIVASLCDRLLNSQHGVLKAMLKSFALKH